jgi:hypothetical protein
VVLPYKYDFLTEDEINSKIVVKLGQVDVLMAQGRRVADAVRVIGVTEILIVIGEMSAAARKVIG